MARTSHSLCLFTLSENLFTDCHTDRTSVSIS
uniref:Uncharacterized protein n=1 Tax=Anguilla anguilla TaxID=7936 RepID=A0A0E9PY07_ANGAN